MCCARYIIIILHCYEHTGCRYEHAGYVRLYIISDCGYIALHGIAFLEITERIAPCENLRCWRHIWQPLNTEEKANLHKGTHKWSSVWIGSGSPLCTGPQLSELLLVVLENMSEYLDVYFIVIHVIL